ncbi:EcsC family protein [Humibacillus xanthopallidus]|uniref:EcsC family protein n=1 Tax=Humibacillus xanthopallidus TaxID=412689 RepID=A0A543PKP1_9MICO|nr:hypothetical protein [Humibacillus xanthopallidus]TQN44641.1 EcsC family protein [Humibacillus xanthopallidus]
MGWLDSLKPKAGDTKRHTASALRAASQEHPGPLGRVVLGAGLDGLGPIRSAVRVAEAALRDADDSEEAVEALVRDHLALSAAGGFLTGVGGNVTLPVALSVNLAEFYLVATRLVGAIAVVRGYDVRQPEVRTAVLLTLVASRSDQVLAKEGFGAGTLARIGLGRMPPGALMLVNKAIFFRLLRRVNKRLFWNLGRGTPLLGGGAGAALDSWMMARIAGQALVEFPVRDATEDPAS